MELSGAQLGAAAAASHNPYRFTRELMEPLQMLYDSLVETGDEAIANGHLLDLIRQARGPGERGVAPTSPPPPLSLSASLFVCRR